MFDRRGYMKEYRIKNKEHLKIKQREYRLKNKEYIKQWQAKYREEHHEELKMKKKQYYMKHKNIISEKHKERNKRKWYVSIHAKTASVIRELWIRPKNCSICWNTGIIEAHHPNYSKWYEIVFCCQHCHHEIHNWYLDKYQTINLKDFIK